MRARWMAGLAVLAVVAAGCGQGGDDDAAPAPTETVTVTETVTAEPTGTDPASPDPGSSATGTASPTTDVCADVAASGGEELAFIFVSEPRIGAEVTPGFEVAGCSNTFEASFQYELLDAEGEALASDFGMASCGTGCVGDLSFTVDYVIDEPQVGSLHVFTTSPKDGAEAELNVLPLRLQP